MQRPARNNRVGGFNPPANLLDRLVYLPGAMVLAYGFWLSLTT